jgi:hypothetical protein
MNDLLYAFRGLLSNPAFAAIAILTLALAVGANTAMFSIFNAVLLRPLAYRQPERLYAVEESVPKFGKLQDKLPVSAHHFLQWRAHTSSFDSLSLVGTTGMSLTSAGDPQNLTIGRISASLFPQLGITPELGRAFTPEEDREGRDRVLVLSHALWVSRFQSDSNVIGRKVLLDGSPYEVIGVLAAEPGMPTLRQLVSLPLGGDDAQAWKPFALRDGELSEMGDFNFGCVALLKPGVTAEQATADLNNVEKAITANGGGSVHCTGDGVAPGHDARGSGDRRRAPCVTRHFEAAHESTVWSGGGRSGDVWIGGGEPGGGYWSGLLHSGVTGYARRSGDRDAVRMMDHRERT